MARVMVDLSISLDGFIAGANDGLRQPLGEGGMRLFNWYFDGDTPSPHHRSAAGRGLRVPPYSLSPGSAGVFEEIVESVGAIVTGRRTYDIAGAWSGNGPIPGRPLFVVTHHVPEDVPAGASEYTFVTDGVESAIAQARLAAGERYVGLMGSAVPQHCLRAGLVDEIQLHLVPVLLGAGVRLFDHLGAGQIELEPLRVVDSPGVTHLRYRIRSIHAAAVASR
jgi:dihydrofolate reductase